MSSWSQIKLTCVAAAAGATAVIVACSATYMVIDHFRSGYRRRKKTKNVPGLYNLGNTCFANALLQSLAACPSFEVWLSNIGQVLPPDTISLLAELGHVVACLNHSSEDHPASADGVLAALRAHRWNITPDIEQDLFELFNVFVTTWDEELAPVHATKAYTFADVAGMQELSSQSHRVELLHSISDLVRARHQYRPPCAGLLGTELHCRNCGVKNVRHDRFCSLDLILPKTTSFTEISVESCLRKYFAQEFLLNYKCEHCASKENGSSSMRRHAMFKKQGISKLPDCLILRIQRVGILPNGAPFKHIDHVNFSETLCVRDFLFYPNPIKKMEWNGGGDWMVRGGGDMEKARSFVKSPEDAQIVDANVGAGDSFGASTFGNQYENRYVYNLRAVVVHIGRPESGHFVAYRRGAGTGRRAPWFFTSDTEVRKVSFENVTSREAYMLFYERLASS